MVQLKYDENGNLIPQTISYKVKHDNEIKELIELAKIKRIVFFDIDGCICPSFFPNLNEKADIKELKQNILNTPLNRAFIQVYKRINKTSEVKIFFLTGRRAKDFENETFDQLKELEISPEQIIFFPNNYSHTKIRYNTFKIYHILSLALKNKPSEVIVYDDLDSYYPKLFSLGLDFGIPKLNLKHVKDHKSFWFRKLAKLNIYQMMRG